LLCGETASEHAMPFIKSKYLENLDSSVSI
jgi:hypothetical protein